jgi:hypothetical protein
VRTAAKLQAVRALFRSVEHDVESCGDPDVLELGVIIALLLAQMADRVHLLNLDELEAADREVNGDPDELFDELYGGEEAVA